MAGRRTTQGEMPARNRMHTRTHPCTHTLAHQAHFHPIGSEGDTPQRAHKKGSKSKEEQGNRYGKETGDRRTGSGKDQGGSTRGGERHGAPKEGNRQHREEEAVRNRDGQQREGEEKQGQTGRVVEREERDRRNTRAGTERDRRAARDSGAAGGGEGEEGRTEEPDGGNEGEMVMQSEARGGEDGEERDSGRSKDRQEEKRMAMTKAAATGRKEDTIVDAAQGRAEGVHKEKEGRDMACNVERVVEDSRQQCSDSNSDVEEEERRRMTTAAVNDSTTSGKVRSNPASATPQREQQANASSEDEEMDGRFVPLSRSREQRERKQVARLGVVMDTPRRRKGEIRKRRPPDQETHMERAGAHGGELKYLIRAGRTLLRRIEREARGDG